MSKVVPIIITIIIIILSSSSSSSSSSTSYFNIPKTLQQDASHNFNTASSQFLSVHIDYINPETPLTVFVPDDHAFADASAAGYKTLPIEKKYFVLKCHMISEYLPPSLLRNTANVWWHLEATVATEILENQKYMLNFSATVNGSVAVSNTYVQAIVTRTIYDCSPIAVYGVTKVLLPRDFPDISPPPLPDISPPPLKTADVSAAAVCGF
ncbi:fasciclin-like arabinogalactan protein, partial [Trifolium medium]|nr:fasciclin-like arabinogalactan protein [Trifolium medium]